MNAARTVISIDLSKSINSLFRSRILFQEGVIGSFQVRCQHCEVHHRRFSSHRLKKRTLNSYQSSYQTLLLASSYGTVSSKDSDVLSMSDVACPQGLQGDIEGDDVTFKLWLENCRRYGLGNCDQQVQGIQSGRKTLAEVMAEQESMITDVVDEYRKLNKERSKMGASDPTALPDINTPCPQGIQGEDCARFKLWLENCHQFRFESCVDQLNNYTKGRKTLVQIFEEQDLMIRKAATVAYQKQIQNNSAGESTETKDGAGKVVPVNMTRKQKLKNAVAVYGSTVIVFHVSISLMSLGFFYTLVSSGVDVVGLLGRLGVGESILQNKLATGTGTFVVAYAVHKIFAPARIAATLTCTPLIVRYLRRVGFLKTPAVKK